MKYIIPISLLLACSLTAGLLSCTKHSGDIEEHLPTATINFASPTAGAVYRPGDSVQVEATAISTETIHGYEISIRKANDTTVYFSQQVHDHNDTLAISKKWKNTVAGVSNLEARIVLTLDHDGHTATKSVQFKVE